MGKLAQGTSIIKLFPGEKIIEVLNISEKENKDLVLITNQASFIKYNTKEIIISKKGSLGTMGINFKDTKIIKDRVINCFINNKYVYIKTNKNRYEKLETDQIEKIKYKKEKKLNIKLNEKEVLKSIFSMIIPENN